MNLPKTICLPALAAASVTFLLFLGTLSCDFVMVDDPSFVLDNPYIKKFDLGLLEWAFTTTHTGQWFPLIWLSFALDHLFWGLNPAGYHLTNTLLHSLNTALVVLLADQFCKASGQAPGHAGEFGAGRCIAPGRYALFLVSVGLLWGIHPLRVESVAWVSERKDVLNGLFALASLISYLKYASAEAGPGKSGRRHLYISFVFYVLSLMSKQMSIVFPVMFLVLDWYPLDRFSRGGFARAVREKLPFFMVAALISYVTLSAVSNQDIMVPLDMLSAGLRVIIAGNALFEYCRWTLVPYGISPFVKLPYPIPYSYGVKAAVALLVFAACAIRYRTSRPVLTAMLLFLLPLLPVIGLLQSGDQAYAARYTYLPGIVFGFLVSRGAVTLPERSGVVCFPHSGRLAAGLLVVIMAIYSVTTLRLAGYWKDTAAYWSRVIEIFPDSLPKAYLNRGGFYHSSGKYEAAVRDFTSVIELETKDGMVPNFNYFALRGDALAKLGRYEAAIRDFDAAISTYQHPAYFHARGMALRSMGKQHEAEIEFTKAGGVTEPIDWYDVNPAAFRP